MDFRNYNEAELERMVNEKISFNAVFLRSTLISLAVGLIIGIGIGSDLGGLIGGTILFLICFGGVFSLLTRKVSGYDSSGIIGKILGVIVWFSFLSRYIKNVKFLLAYNKYVFGEKR